MLSTCKSVSDLDALCENECSMITILLANKCLVNNPPCIKCGSLMSLRKRGDTKEWRCRDSKKKDCSSRSVKSGSFFSHSNLPLKTSMKLVYMWINRYSHFQIKAELKVSDNTIVDWRNFCRELCTRICSKYPQIGGEGKIVQIDESAVHTRKYGRGEKERELTWILGGVEVGSRKCFAVVVKNRTAKEMLPILKKYIHPLSTVHSDMFRSYATLKNVFKNHYSVNHSLQFTRTADDGSVIHTNQIESLWQRIKKPLKQGNGTSEGLLGSYIDEIIVREWEQDNMVPALIEEIVNFVQKF